MKNLSFLLTAGVTLIVLSGCSSVEEASGEVETALQNDTGEGSLELLTPEITTQDEEIEIETHGIDEDKVTYITIANETVYAEPMENDTVYTFNISDIDSALSTDYDPKIQLIQTDNNDLSDEADENITTFKQERYSVEPE